MNADVLVVDSVPSRLTAITRILDEAGYRTHAASTFSEGKQCLSESPPHVLIAQLRLGPYNGLHLVLRGLQRSPGMGAVVTSRVKDVVLAAEATRQGATFLQWPVSESDLLTTVRAVLDRSVDIEADLPADGSIDAGVPSGIRS